MSKFELTLKNLYLFKKKPWCNYIGLSRIYDKSKYLILAAAFTILAALKSGYLRKRTGFSTKKRTHLDFLGGVLWVFKVFLGLKLKKKNRDFIGFFGGIFYLNFFSLSIFLGWVFWCQPCQNSKCSSKC